MPVSSTDVAATVCSSPSAPCHNAAYSSEDVPLQGGAGYTSFEHTYQFSYHAPITQLQGALFVTGITFWTGNVSVNTFNWVNLTATPTYLGGILSIQLVLSDNSVTPVFGVPQTSCGLSCTTFNLDGPLISASFGAWRRVTDYVSLQTNTSTFTIGSQPSGCDTNNVYDSDKQVCATVQFYSDPLTRSNVLDQRFITGVYGDYVLNHECGHSWDGIWSLGFSFSEPVVIASVGLFQFPTLIQQVLNQAPEAVYHNNFPNIGVATANFGQSVSITTATNTQSCYTSTSTSITQHSFQASLAVQANFYIPFTGDIHTQDSYNTSGYQYNSQVESSQNCVMQAITTSGSAYCNLVLPPNSIGDLTLLQYKQKVENLPWTAVVFYRGINDSQSFGQSIAGVWSGTAVSNIQCSAFSYYINTPESPPPPRSPPPPPPSPSPPPPPPPVPVCTHVTNRWLLTGPGHVSSGVPDDIGGWLGTAWGGYAYDAESPGNSLGAIVFDGSSGYVDLGSHSLSAPLSIVFWAKVNVNQPCQRFFDWGGYAASSVVNSIFMSPDSATSCSPSGNASAGSALWGYVSNVAGGAGAKPPFVTGFNAQVGIWNHYIVTFDAAGGVVIFVNGTSVFTGTSSVAAMATRTHLFLGKSWYVKEAYFNGALSNFQLMLGTALTPFDAKNMFQTNTCPPVPPPLPPGPPPSPPTPPPSPPPSPPTFTTPSTLAPPGYGVLVFSHRVDGTGNASQFFTNAFEVLSASGDPTAPVHKYSLLLNLANYINSAGGYEFKLVVRALSYKLQRTTP